MIGACMLDCYDNCSFTLENNTIKANKNHPYTQNYLCPHLNHYDNHKRITSARYKGKNINLDKALEILKELLEETPANKTLHYTGSGNIGKFQAITDLFFAQHKASLTNGSLCDGAGQSGITEGRGINYMLEPQTLLDSDVIIFWGRNPSVTNAHIIPFIKGKKIIVIDPYKTNLAKKADIHLQIKPKGDLYLALLLSRFIFIEGSEDNTFLDKYTDDAEEFYGLTQQYQVKKTLKNIDINLGDLGAMLKMITNAKVSIIIGVGVQKYAFGEQVIRAIDGLGAVLGLYGKKGSGIGFLGDTSVGIKNPFSVKAKKYESKITTPFEQYDLVFIQGANPVNQMPNSQTVKDKLAKTKHKIYFGLYENETSELVDLVIPAKTFLEKKDIRFSYSKNEVQITKPLRESNIGISEYDLSNYLHKSFKYKTLKTEDEYQTIFKDQCIEENGILKVKNYPEHPYKDGFEDEFIFLDSIDDESLGNKNTGFYLLSPKSKHSLNSQFKRETKLYIHPKALFVNGDKIKASSKFGNYIFEIQTDENLREDCILIYSGTKGVNHLTQFKKSDDGFGAIFQEVKVKLEKI